MSRQVFTRTLNVRWSDCKQAMTVQHWTPSAKPVQYLAIEIGCLGRMVHPIISTLRQDRRSVNLRRAGAALIADLDEPLPSKGGGSTIGSLVRQRCWPIVLRVVEAFS
jgi:hypothetical protein